MSELKESMVRSQAILMSNRNTGKPIHGNAFIIDS